MGDSEESHHTRLSEPPHNAVDPTNWDGYAHGVGGRCVSICDFCRGCDESTKIKGSAICGVVFACPKCLPVFEEHIRKICGPKLSSLIERNEQIMVPRTKGPPEKWYLSSVLPTLHKGIWCLHVQSKKSLRDEDCLQKVVTIAQLNELN